MPDFTVVVLSGSFAAGVAITLDVLGAAASLAPGLKLPRPTWRVMSVQGGLVPLTGGLHVDTDCMPAKPRADASTWIIPGLAMNTPAAVANRLAASDARQATDAVRRHVAHGGHVAASCSGVFLLQAAGLVQQRRVTTCWWLAPELHRLEPGSTVDADRMVCADGPVHTAGAAMAHSDLMLHLLRIRFGSALAEAVSRTLLIDARQAQAPFVVPAMKANGNELVSRLTRRIESALPTPPSVTELASEFAMSERTLARHVRAATGHGTLALVQGVRLNRARTLIETTRLSIEQVAAEVGYEDATALRRLMRKTAGATPSQFRPALDRSA
ncbi:GlxA family transcriptional regulator [Piscinibacter terrae]|uniref:Helix-turn-helix domain-containing protein n=1 Tax=Piscinibacter terrae TaxID=2496871 RepID=A0A3N7HK60_9BURK|nr:helix-turn-helix domain-containing protein [Albitalea terrae]RQP21923.1 helix-turn-helix domain-containing protein [Albitalea terrae]